MTMEKNYSRIEQPKLLSEQLISDQLVKQIRKLHWIGLDHEAERLKTALSHLMPADSVLANPSDTD